MMSLWCAILRLSAGTLVLLMLTRGANAWGLSSPMAAHPPGGLVEVDFRVPRAVQDVLDQISKADTQPTCQRIAAKGLLNACENFDSSQYVGSVPSNEVVEDYQKLYAIRLTRCEIDDTDVQFPALCEALFYENPGPGSLHQRLPQCIAQLEGLGSTRSTGWTTYMQKRSETSVMCQAIRAQHDKDEAVRFYRYLAAQVGQLGAAMKDLPNVTRLFENMRDNIGAYHQTLQKEFQDSQSAMREGLNELKDNLKSTLDNLAGLEQRAANGVDLLRQHAEDMKDAAVKAAVLGTDVGVYGTQISLLNTELQDFPIRMASGAEQVIAQFSDRVVAITDSIELANNASSQLFAYVNHFTGQLSAVMNMVGDINSGVGNALSQQQALRAQFEEMHVEVNQTRESVESLNEAVGKLANMGDTISGFIGLFQSGFSMNGVTWQLLALISAAMLVTTHKFLPLLPAVFTAFITGAALSRIVAPLLQLAPLEALDNHPYAVLIVGSWILAVLFGIWALRLLSKPRAHKEYDPESPKYPFAR